MTDPIVVGIDGTGRSLRALMWGAHDASLRGCPLRLVHVLPRYEGDFFLFPPGRFEDAEERGKEFMGEAVSLVHETYPGVEVSTDLPMGSPAAVFREESANAEAVVLGSKGENVGNLLLGSTAWQLVGHATCPVVVVPHFTTGHHWVVAGTDGSTDSLAALEYAFREASLRKAHLQVINALGLPQGWPTHLLRPEPPDDAEVTQRREQVEQQVAPLREQYPDVKVTVDVHHVAAVHTLAQASQKADLLVMGSRGRGGFHGLAVGSVTHEVLHFAGCPVAVVRATR